MRLFEIVCTGLVFAAAAVASGRTSGGDEVLRVMTFNIRYGSANDGENAWAHRKQLVTETIGAFDPDLLGTQEVLAMQFDYLAEHLKDYTLAGVGRNDGKRAGEFAPVLFKTKRFQLIDSGTFWLSETPEVPGSKSWDSDQPRIATWARLRDRQAGGRELCFLNTHWDNRGRQARHEAGKLIRAWLNEHAAGMPTIVTGDLNEPASADGLKALLVAEGSNPPLVDVFRQAHPEPSPAEGTFHVFTGRTRGRRIDFILASPAWQCTKATIDHTQYDGRYPSDHFPVTAVLRYAP